MSTQRVPGSLFLPVTAVLIFALPLPDWIVENGYSNGFYRWWQAWLTSLSNLAPLAFLDMFVLGALALTIWRIVRLVGVARSQGIFAAIWEGLRRLLRDASLAALVFLLFWGLNYRRVPLADRVQRTTPTVEDLKAIIADADALGGRLRPSAYDYPRFSDVTQMLHQPLNDALVKLKRSPLETASRPKYSLVLTPFFTWAGINGMVNPFALETIVHPDLLPFERPFAIAHEWAHLAGAADEAEANAIGWLACMNGPPELAYSASVYLIVEAGNALPEPAWREASKKLDAGIRSDLTALAHRHERQKPEVQRTAFRVYGEYLRVNRVDDGVASYNRSLSLIMSPALREALSVYRVQHPR